jgi:hypothetical protein
MRRPVFSDVVPSGVLLLLPFASAGLLCLCSLLWSVLVAGPPRPSGEAGLEVVEFHGPAPEWWHPLLPRRP